ncbi:MAG: ribonuclease H-like domain-containing protein [Nitrosotalea sp.]
MKQLDPKSYRCEHSHNGIEHRSCYVNYLIDNYPSRVGYLDIETSNLNASFGIVYTWAIKSRGTSKVITGRITKNDFNTFPHDKRIVKDLIDEMKRYDVVVTYYGTGFDIPFIRSRALKSNLVFPFYREINHLDLYYVVRHRLKLHSNRLASATQFLGIEGKTNIDNDFWARAVTGHTKSIDYILKHNIGDVEILEKLHNRLMPYMQNTRRSI